MKPPIRLWQDIIERYRASDWLECVRIARDAVDSHPDDLAARFLLARLHVRLGDPHLAQLQYERLLPLAVGQGDLLRALAAQKQLDLLGHGLARHARRYAAMHQWFRSLGSKGLAGARVAGPHRILTADLIRLDAERFGQIAESARIEVVDLDARDIEAREGVLWVALYGQVRAYIDSTTLGEMSEFTVRAGESLCCAIGRDDVAGLRLIPELPTEFLAFDPALLAELGIADREHSAPPLEIEVEPTPDPLEATLALTDLALVEPPAPEDQLTPAQPPTAIVDLPAPVPAVGRRAGPPRPVPDPVAEPWVAMSAPIEKRPVTRIAISLEDRSALLGLAGTRVAPIRGVLHSLSAAMILIGFPREEMLPLRRALDRSVVRVQLTLAGRVVLHLGVRMAWVDADITSRDGLGESDAIFALEFLSVGVGDHLQIGSAVASRGSARAAVAA